MAEVCLGEAIAALSLAIDIGMGQPLEQGLRTCLVATGLARKVGIDEENVRRVFYLSLLRHVGCTAESDMAASYLGDEIAFRSGAVTLDFTKPSAMFPYMVRNVGAGKSIFGRARHVGKLTVGSKKFLGAMDATCETGQLLATRLGFDEVIQRARSGRSSNTGTAMACRAGLAARTSSSLPASWPSPSCSRACAARRASMKPAVAVIEERRGKAFAPEVADCLRAEAKSFLPAFEQESVWDDVLDAEPLPSGELSDEKFDEVLAAIADFTDLKSTYTLGHSRGVAELAAAAAEVARLPPAETTSLRRAGLVHDVGRVGISASVWGKRGTLTRDEWEKVRLHPYYTERVLTRPAALARLGELASTHHERLDGGGYHRAVPGSVLSRPARLLAAADGYRARIEERPHRLALSPEDAATSLREDVRNGRLDADTVEAVLAAAGQGAARRRRSRIAGLTDREVQVLSLVAQGQSIREIAGVLTISPKTVDAHIQHIYTKLGVSTRAGATLFAVENGLVDRAKDRETSR